MAARAGFETQARIRDVLDVRGPGLEGRAGLYQSWYKRLVPILV